MPFKVLSSFFAKSVVKNVDSKLRKEKEGVQRKIFAFDGDAETVVKEEIASFETRKLGIFISSHFRKEKPNSIFGKVLSFRYNCERCATPCGKSTNLEPSDLPLSTRANGCRAFAIHQFYTINNVKICVQRVYPIHNGHNPDNPDEIRQSRICSELREKIQVWFLGGFSLREVHERCLAWAKSKGFNDPNDHRYYPSDKDLYNFKRYYKSNLMRKHQMDLRQLENLFQTVYKDHIILYEHLDHLAKQNSQPTSLIIVMTPWQKEVMKIYGNEIVFLLSTNIHGYTMFSLIVKNDCNEGVPVCFAFMEKPTEELLYKFFYNLYEFLLNDGFLWRPDACMIDVALKDTKFLHELFDNQTSILLCWYQVIEIVMLWLMSDSNGYREDKATRDRVLQLLWSLKHSSIEEEFAEKWNTQTPYLPEKVVKYLQDHFKLCSEVWSNYGIRFYLDYSDPEIDRFFVTVRTHFVQAYSEHSLEEMLKLFCIDQQQPETVQKPKATEADLAKEMVLQGWGKKVNWLSHLQQKVQSFSLPGILYNVNVVESSCSCPRSSGRRQKCKHLYLVEFLLASDCFPITVDQLREREAKSLFRHENFAVLDNYFLLANPSTGSATLLDIDATQCYCRTAEYCRAEGDGSECVCMKTFKLWRETDSRADYEDIEDDSFMDTFFDSPQNDAGTEMQRMCQDILCKLRSDSRFQPTDSMLTDMKQFHANFLIVYEEKRGRKRKSPE